MISNINESKTVRMPGMSLQPAAFGRPWAADPDELSGAVQKAASRLGEDRRASYNRRVISILAELGLDVRAILYLSGIVEQEPADLTPSEIGHLFRYIRINLPWVLVESDKLFDGLGQMRASRKAA